MPMQVETYTDPRFAVDTNPRLVVSKNSTSLTRIQIFNPPEDKQGQPSITTAVYLEFEVPDDNPIVAEWIVGHAQAAREALAAQFGDAVSPMARDRENRKLTVRVVAESSQDSPLVDQVVATLKTIPEVNGHVLISEALAAAVMERKKDASNYNDSESDRKNAPSNTYHYRFGYKAPGPDHNGSGSSMNL